jgi:transposase
VGDDTAPTATGEDANGASPKRGAGKQPGARGFWRSEPLVATGSVPHYPETCEKCALPLIVSGDARKHKAYYVLELEKLSDGFGMRIVCTLQEYYTVPCSCGHETTTMPGEGHVSTIEGRKRQLTLKEEVLVGPQLACFLAALSVRYRMSRSKIREFLAYWMGTKLSNGTLCRCIREAGVACLPVVEQLTKDLQEAKIINLDETPWFENKLRLWLWVAVSMYTVVFVIGTRKKEVLLDLVSEAFLGWLVTDGYGVYRDRLRRQRCLAHLIRKAIALAEAIGEKPKRFGEWLLRELRQLIHTVAEAGEDAKKQTPPILARLKRACLLGAKEKDHSKLRALAREILADWDAVVAFVKNPDLPPTNNDAERVLRHAVISRGISFGTRTSEGSRAYAALLSVIETCHRRRVDPWAYIAQTIALGRKGIAPVAIPLPVARDA